MGFAHAEPCGKRCAYVAHLTLPTNLVGYCRFPFRCRLGGHKLLGKLQSLHSAASVTPRRDAPPHTTGEGNSSTTPVAEILSFPGSFRGDFFSPSSFVSSS